MPIAPPFSATSPRSSRNARRAGAHAQSWYWRQALGTLPHALRGRMPRLETFYLRRALHPAMWRRQPAFAAAAISTQAIGIAVTTAVLAVAYAVLVRPLPYAHPERLVHLFEGTGRSGALSYQDFLDVRRANRAFEQVAGYSGGSRTLTAPAWLQNASPWSRSPTASSRSSA